MQVVFTPLSSSTNSAGLNMFKKYAKSMTLLYVVGILYAHVMQLKSKEL